MAGEPLFQSGFNQHEVQHMPEFNPDMILFTPDALNKQGRELADQFPGAKMLEVPG